MSENGLFALHGEDAVHHLGVIYSTSEATLRAFGASYMRDPKTIGSLKLVNPSGQLVATFDVWTDNWKDTACDAASSSICNRKTVG